MTNYKGRTNTPVGTSGSHIMWRIS